METWLKFAAESVAGSGKKNDEKKMTKRKSAIEKYKEQTKSAIRKLSRYFKPIEREILKEFLDVVTKTDIENVP